jgi:hypothetical protein
VRLKRLKTRFVIALRFRIKSINQYSMITFDQRHDPSK